MTKGTERIRPRSALARCLLPAALFTALMAAFFLGVDAYLDDGAELIPGGELEAIDGRSPIGEDSPWRIYAPRTRWEAQGGFAGSGGVRLDSAERRGGVLEYVIENPRRFSYLRVEGLVRIEDVSVGKRPWDAARILLFFRDAEGRPRWRHPHNVCFEVGTLDWHRCEEVIRVPEFAVTGHLYVQNAGRGGRMWIDDLSVVPVRLRPSFDLWRWAFALGWVAMGLTCVFMLRLWGRPFGLAIVAVAALIAVGLTVPGDVVEEAAREQIVLIDNLREAAVGAAAPAAESAAPGGAGAKRNGADATGSGGDRRASTRAAKSDAGQGGGKTGAADGQPRTRRVSPDRLRDYLDWIKSRSHQWLFALLAALTAASLGRGLALTPRPAAEALASIVLAVAGLLLFAAATEVLQFASYSRGPSVEDWIIDSGGIALGLVIGAPVWPLTAWRASRRRAAQKPPVRSG